MAHQPTCRPDRQSLVIVQAGPIPVPERVTSWSRTRFCETCRHAPPVEHEAFYPHMLTHADAAPTPGVQAHAKLGALVSVDTGLLVSRSYSPHAMAANR